MNKNLFREVSEEDFLETIRFRIEERGRSSIIEALINEDNRDSILEQESKEIMNSIANISND